MKKLFLEIGLLVVASQAQAGNEHNFQACAANDPSWMSRFGQYLVSYDGYDANEICIAQNARAMRMGCYLNGEWATAGYYCEELAPGRN